MKKAPVINLHIGSLIEKLEISNCSCVSKNDSKEAQECLMKSATQTQELIQSLLIKAINNARVVLDKEHDLDNNQQKQPH